MNFVVCPGHPKGSAPTSGSGFVFLTKTWAYSPRHAEVTDLYIKLDGWLRQLVGLTVSDKTVEEVTESAGRAAQAMLAEEVIRAKTAKLPPAGRVLDWRQDKLPFLYVEPDGSMVPMRPADRPEQRPTHGYYQELLAPLYIR